LTDEEEVAAELLGTHFGGDHDIFMHIMPENAEKGIPQSLIIALCEGWPESEELTRIYESARKERREVNYSTYFHLKCRVESSESLFNTIINDLPTFNLHPVYDPSWNNFYPVIRRIKTDEIIFTMLTRHLQNNPTSSEKITILKLIGAAKGLSPELRNWCIGELDCQLRGMEPPEIGIDFTTGENQPVAYTLLDILSKPSWSES
jgi:hypothetical protein